MNELTALLCICGLLILCTAILIMYGDKNHKVLWISFFGYTLVAFLTIYGY